jgi:hypothetical protein
MGGSRRLVQSLNARLRLRAGSHGGLTAFSSGSVAFRLCHCDGPATEVDDAPFDTSQVSFRWLRKHNEVGTTGCYLLAMTTRSIGVEVRVLTHTIRRASRMGELNFGNLSDPRAGPFGAVQNRETAPKNEWWSKLLYLNRQ